MQKNAVMVAPSAWLLVKKRLTHENFVRTEYLLTSHWSEFLETRTAVDEYNPESYQTIFTKKEIKEMMRNPEINIDWHRAIVDVFEDFLEMTSNAERY